MHELRSGVATLLLLNVIVGPTPADRIPVTQLFGTTAVAVAALACRGPRRIGLVRCRVDFCAVRRRDTRRVRSYWSERIEGAMMSATEVLACAFFFVAGTVGLLRLPDVYTRLHAVTKADNLGLGFVALALTLEASTLSSAIEIGIVWLWVIGWSRVASQLVAERAIEQGELPWRPV